MSRNGSFLHALKLFLFAFIILASVFQGPAFAGAIVKEEKLTPPDAGGKPKPPVTMFVSATKHEIPVEKVTRAVTVITREEIERSGKIFLFDLLRGVPGVAVNQLGSYGRDTQVAIRGNNKEGTLIMMDGVQITNANQSQASLQNLTTADIERIEILRGPQSVLYGADAAGGLINIITKADRKKGIHGDGDFQYGTHRSFYEEGGLHGGTEKLQFSAVGARMDTDGLSDNDDYENNTARAHAKLHVTENSNLDVAFHHYNSIVGLDDGITGGAFRTDPNRNSRSNQQVLNTKYTIALADWWQQHAQYTLFHDSTVTHDPRNPDLRTGADPESALFKLNSNRHNFEYQSNFYIQDWNVLTVGYEFEHANVVSKSTSKYDRLTRNHGWFAQNELTLWKIWTIVAGIRFDRHELYGVEASPLISTGFWIAKTQTKIKGSFGKGFRAPTTNQLFFPGFGNPDLLPETTWAWDAGFEQFYLSQRGSFSAMYFDSRTQNLIVNSAPGFPGAANVGSAHSQGIELENRFEILKGLYFTTNYTYTNSFNRDTKKRLLRIPRHMGKFGLTYDYKILHFTGDWYWQGSTEDSSFVRLDEYMRLDLMLAVDITKYFQVYGRVENATNDNYYEARGYDMPHTGFFTGIKGKF